MRKALIGLPVTVIYNNGAKVHARLRELTFTIDGSKREFTWRSPIIGVDRALFLNPDEVYAVWQGKV